MQLRNALHYLGTAAVNNGHSDERGRSSVTILSCPPIPELSPSVPQLAAFAASQGLPTVLVIGPQQEPDTTATLRTACCRDAVPYRRTGQASLRVIVSDDHVDVPLDAALTVVVVCVVDGGSPRIPDIMRTTATVLGVSSGVATAEQLARVAVNADADGREITGILVADPEPRITPPAASRSCHGRRTGGDPPASRASQRR